MLCHSLHLQCVCEWLQHRNWRKLTGKSGWVLDSVDHGHLIPAALNLICYVCCLIRLRPSRQLKACALVLVDI